MQPNWIESLRMTEGPIVCNAGPLIALSIVGQLGLLEKLYRRVLVPHAVIQEVVGAGAGRIGAAEVAVETPVKSICSRYQFATLCLR